ncbi:8-oxo-dGTP diphosphatase MutT [Corallincola platygyrae]|uniref:8-oxo-dGTP diphosphatase n=1 Tax=Corallincola platygyrae TaxID=1193278 RepID=A0ABW4XQ34_9GAMM
MKAVEIAVGIVIRRREQIEVLVAKRKQGQHLAGTWEFPGGKVESGESNLQALRRELLEEVGINPVESQLFEHITHRYPEKHVSINFYLVERFEGSAKGNESQEIRWITAPALPELNVPQANLPIIQRLVSEFSAKS